MENWRKNSRKDIVMVDVDALVPKDHLLRKIEACTCTCSVEEQLGES